MGYMAKLNYRRVCNGTSNGGKMFIFFCITQRCFACLLSLQVCFIFNVNTCVEVCFRSSIDNEIVFMAVGFDFFRAIGAPLRLLSICPFPAGTFEFNFVFDRSETQFSDSINPVRSLSKLNHFCGSWSCFHIEVAFPGSLGGLQPLGMGHSHGSPCCDGAAECGSRCSRCRALRVEVRGVFNLRCVRFHLDIGGILGGSSHES